MEDVRGRTECSRLGEVEVGSRLCSKVAGQVGWLGEVAQVGQGLLCQVGASQVVGQVGQSWLCGQVGRGHHCWQLGRLSLQGKQPEGMMMINYL